MAEMQRPAIQSEGFAWGMGWRVGEIHGAPAIHHGGVVPHFRGKLVMLPDERWGVVILTNVSSVLPIPISPTSHRMADNIAGALRGTPLPTASSPLTRIYLGIDVGIVLLTLSQIRDIVALRRWRAQLAKKSPRSIAVGLGGELLVQVALLLGLPLVLRLPWSEVLRSTPDIGYWLIGTSLIGLVTWLYKAVMAYQFMRTQRTRAISLEPSNPAPTL
jgi:hypothetical protein